ncbi:MAG: aminotransferase class I/II-fold pyridoxal phosphate-dependent enzyme [Saprospiraceae bacterium]|nr:aminotransferase class I/II-fold pyridoxal phosphate-dependent enzyme [Saprospiraceae bacterium]
MFKPASRLDGIAEYYFAGKLREIAQLRQNGHPVLNLGIGSPDLPPAPPVIEALQTAAAHPAAHAYQPYSGIAELRQAWADWYQRWYGVRLNPQTEALPLIGSKEGIVHVAMSFLEPGDIALCPNPGYPTYRAATLLAGAEVQHYHLAAATQWLPDLPALEKTDLRRVKIMWVNYPHMPTGARANPDFFQQLVDFGRRHHILIVNDNPYSFILNEQPISILRAEGAFETALELNSLSKSHNLAGWRVGLVAGHAEHLQAILRFKSNMDSGQFQPVQLAAARALQLPEAWYQGLNDTYRERQGHAFALLKTLGCRFDEQQQGMFVWAEIPKGFRDGYDLSDRLLYEQDLFLTPGGIFGSAGDAYIRVSLCSPSAVLAEAQQRAQAFVAAAPAVSLPMANAL